MSQLNVDILTNRAGTSGPTVSGNLTVNGSTNITGSLSFGENLNVAGIVTANSFVSPSGGLNISGVTTSTRFTSTQATGTAPLTVSSTTLVTNLNADLLDNQQGSFYQNADNLNAGSVPSARLASGTASIDTFLRGDRTWANITSYSDYGSLEQVSGTTRKSISAITSLNARYADPWYPWSSGGPWTTFYTYGGSWNGSSSSAYDAEQGAWWALGFSPNSSYGSYLTYTHNTVRQQIGVNGNNIGPQNWVDNFYWTSNQYSYAPVSFLMMPIRNNSASSITTTIYGVMSSYYSSGYDGASAWVYAPGTNGTYNISSGGWTRMHGYAGTTSATTYSYSVTIPANTTYVFMQMASILYYSAGSSSIGYLEMNKFYALGTTFTNANLQVDSRMINTMRFADWQRYGLTSTNAFQFYKVYNACADMYGNR